MKNQSPKSESFPRTPRNETQQSTRSGNLSPATVVMETRKSNRDGLSTMIMQRVAPLPLATPLNNHADLAASSRLPQSFTTSEITKAPLSHPILIEIHTDLENFRKPSAFARGFEATGQTTASWIEVINLSSQTTYDEIVHKVINIHFKGKPGIDIDPSVSQDLKSRFFGYSFVPLELVGVDVVWHDVPSKGLYSIPLKERGQEYLLDVMVLIAKRGWRDILRVNFREVKPCLKCTATASRVAF